MGHMLKERPGARELVFNEEFGVIKPKGWMCQCWAGKKEPNWHNSDISPQGCIWILWWGWRVSHWRFASGVISSIWILPFPHSFLPGAPDWQLSSRDPCSAASHSSLPGMLRAHCSRQWGCKGAGGVWGAGGKFYSIHHFPSLLGLAWLHIWQKQGYYLQLCDQILMRQFFYFCFTFIECLDAERRHCMRIKPLSNLPAVANWSYFCVSCLKSPTDSHLPWPTVMNFSSRWSGGLDWMLLMETNFLPLRGKTRRPQSITDSHDFTDTVLPSHQLKGLDTVWLKTPLEDLTWWGLVGLSVELCSSAHWCQQELASYCLRWKQGTWVILMVQHGCVMSILAKTALLIHLCSCIFLWHSH